MKRWPANKYKILFLIYFFIVSINDHAGASEANPANNEEYILIINSYSEASPWSRNYTSAIYEKLIKADNELTAYTEHMNMLLIEKEEDLSAFKRDFLHKYTRPPRMIMLLGNPSYTLLINELEKMWGKDIPILLCAEKDYIGPKESYFNEHPLAKGEGTSLAEHLKSHPQVTTLHSPVYIKETVGLMKKLIPDMQKLLFLTDKTFLGQQNLQAVREVMQSDYSDMELAVLSANEVSNRELIDSLRKAETSSKAGVLLASWTFKTIQGDNYVLSTDIYKMLGNYTSLPVFVITDMEIDRNSLLGGYFYRESYLSEAVVNTSRKLLDGQIFHSFIYPEGPEPVLDYQALKQKGLNLSDCPEETFFYLKPVTFWEQYKYPLSISILVILFILSILYMKTKMLVRRQASQEREIQLMKEYSIMVNNMPICYMKHRIQFDASGNPADFEITDINVEFEKQLLSRSMIVGRKGSEFNDKIFSGYLKMCSQILLQNQKINVQYYHRETDRHFNVFAVASSEPDTINLFLSDITELQKTQILVHAINYKLAMSLDVANITPWRWDLKKHIILCDVNKPVNQSNRNGLINEDTLSVPDSKYFAKIPKADRERVKLAYENLINGKTDKIKEEYRIYSNEGGYNHFDWVEVRAAVEKKDESGQAASLVGSSLLITERKKIEQELLQAKNKAEESNRLKSAFLANMSHEIRTPLNAIVGFSTILATADKEEEKQEFVSIIENNNTLLLQLISDILDLSKIEAGTLDFVYSDADVNSIMKELEHSLLMKTAEGVRLSFRDFLPDCRIRIDKNRLSQVMINLLTNAIKFTKEGRIDFGYRLIDNRMLEFYVSDSGCGIEKEQQKKIFERFVKLNSFAQGTGLGLSISRMIVEHFGGEMRVESEPGKGSVFYFTIPYMPVEEKKIEPVATIEKKKAVKDEIIVLIAEDNASNFKLFNTILKRDYTILHAWNGREAIDLYEQYTPHIVLMDINMPVMNGYDATKEIRNLSKNVPIIAITAYAFASDEQRIMDSGFDAYTAKPINASDLTKKISELLNKRLCLI